MKSALLNMYSEWIINSISRLISVRTDASLLNRRYHRQNDHFAGD